MLQFLRKFLSCITADAPLAKETSPNLEQLPVEIWRKVALHLDQRTLAAWLQSSRFFAASIRPAAAFHEEWHHMRYYPDPVLKVGLLQPRDPRGAPCKQPVRVLVVAPDGCTAVMGAGISELQVWDLRSGTCKGVLRGPSQSRVTWVVLLDSGRKAVSASIDTALRVWDLASCTCTATWTGHTGLINDLTALPGGHSVVSAAQDGTMRVWNMESGTCTAVLNEGGSREIWTAVLALGPTSVVAAALWAQGDRALQIWDLCTCTCTAVLSGGTQHIYRHLTCSTYSLRPLTVNPQCGTSTRSQRSHTLSHARAAGM
mmetsp:Transcript_33977/g.75326  ORF Transcript_33977/g.75326 Transcript_33977/m.75326 type:complete len:315 (+) Transcript_33977:216-1160(+)